MRSRTTTRNALARCVVAVVLCIYGCDGAGGSATEDAAQAPPDTPAEAEVAVHYDLRWSWGRGHALDDGQGWETVSDLGYRVQVHQGYAVSYSMELIPCEPPPDDTEDRGSLGALKLLWLPALLARPAHANHGAWQNNPIGMYVPHAERLTPPGDLALGTSHGTLGDYCGFHYLVARANRDTKLLPDEPRIMGASLHLEGVYYAPEATVPEPFRIHTSLPIGRIWDIAEVDIVRSSDDPPTGGIVVRVHKDLGALFDGVDFAALTGALFEQAALNALIAACRVEITR